MFYGVWRKKKKVGLLQILEVIPPHLPNTRLTSRVPNHQSLMWSQMALAADMALESFLALMTAAPRSCTVCRRQREEEERERDRGGFRTASLQLKEQHWTKETNRFSENAWYSDKILLKDEIWGPDDTHNLQSLFHE